MPVMQPVFHAAVLICSARLSQLVLVVREYQICTAAVNVELRREMTSAHGAALDVPSWPPSSPRALQYSSSSGFAAFHNAKSAGLRFLESTATRLPARVCSIDMGQKQREHHVPALVEESAELLVF
ncbi:hypothetical protein Bca4012_037193 [Brassica carinata]